MKDKKDENLEMGDMFSLHVHVTLNWSLFSGERLSTYCYGQTLNFPLDIWF